MQDKLPTHASVVVIGGGIMGCSTLYHLAKDGVSDAILVERNSLTSGTTWHSAAQVRALRSTRNLTDLIKYSIDLYSRLEQETGQMTGWINKGSLSIATTPDRLIHIKRQAALARLFGVEAETVTADEAFERWPYMNHDDVIGAVWSPDDGRVSPSDLCAALVKGARSKGAKIFENTGVTGITTKDNKVTGIVTTAGEIRCDAIVICAGLWSQKVAGMAGSEVPVYPCEHFYLLTKPIDGISGNLPTLSDHDNHLYIRDDSGGLLVGCFEPIGKPISPDRIGDDFAFQLLPEDWDHFEPMMVNALNRLPALEHAEVKMLLNGPESFTPDGSFLLGETAETRGLFLGCGMNSVGVATGGGAGMALAHCVQYGHPPADLHEADPKRFSSEFNSAKTLAARVPEVLGKHYEITYPGRQWRSARNLVKTPLHDKWKEERAWFGQVQSWERPLYFGCNKPPNMTFGMPEWHDHVAQEVESAHKKAAIFDQSTFGKIDITGKDSCSFLNRICGNQMDRQPGKVIYTAMLNDKGGFESDLTAMRIAADHYRLFVGTSAIKRDLAWLRRHINAGEDVSLKNSTHDYAVIALMGPNASKIADDIGAGALNQLKFFEACHARILDNEIYGARLSYVGEPGWEITCKSNMASALYSILKDAGAKPAGLFAQTAMRIEKRFLAYGHELDTDINPLEAGLEFAIDWNKEFIGRDALIRARDNGAQNRIMSIKFNDRDAIPLGNEPVYLNNDIVGKTTSASFGYRVGASVALADISRIEARSSGTVVEVDIAGDRYKGTISTTAMFDPSSTRMRV